MKPMTMNYRDDQARMLSEVARASGLSNSELARMVFDSVDLTAVVRQRMQWLEQITAETLAKNAKASPSSTAAAEHLAEHRRLCGFTPNEEPSND